MRLCAVRVRFSRKHKWGRPRVFPHWPGQKVMLTGKKPVPVGGVKGAPQPLLNGGAKSRKVCAADVISLYTRGLLAYVPRNLEHEYADWPKTEVDMGIIVASPPES